ncbi:MAG: hypothetical protein J6A01_08155, partial [Proteobacteria bacterium]|nr:hypothetical protein [Pseudomonadota bacterium]
RYKFNPPDDRRQEPIIHEYITYGEPENHYKVGDPLPIVYRTDDHYFYDTVQSMPFPIPFADLMNNNTIVAQSSSAFEDKDDIKLPLISDKEVSFVIRMLRRFESAQNDCYIYQYSLGDIFKDAFKAKEDFLEFYTEDFLKLLSCIWGVMQKKRYATSYHAACVRLLIRVGFDNPSLPEEQRAAAVLSIINRYIHQTPRSQQLPDPEAVTVIMTLPEHFQNAHLPQSALDGFYAGLIELMCDSNVSDDIRFRLASYEWPNAPVHVIDCIINVLKKCDPDIPENYFLKNNNQKERIIQDLECIKLERTPRLTICGRQINVP